VTDEYGAYPTLRYCETSLQVNALPMRAKALDREQ
jgi:hypothetical protein